MDSLSELREGCSSGRGVLSSLRRLEATLCARGDRSAVFCSAYVVMTEAILARLDGSFFADDRWIESLLVAFARRYFDALCCREEGRAPPPAWRRAFEAPRELPVLNHLLLGMNAHILRDLPFTLAEHMPRERGSPCQQDFLRLIHVVRRAIDPIQDRVATLHAPGLLLLDRLFLRADEWSTLALVWCFRRASLRQARSLQEAADPAPLARRIELRADRVARALLRLPPTRQTRRWLARLEQEDPRAWPFFGGLLRELFARLA